MSMTVAETFDVKLCLRRIIAASNRLYRQLRSEHLEERELVEHVLHGAKADAEAALSIITAEHGDVG